MIHNIYIYIYNFFNECFKEKEKKYTLNECLEILNKNFELSFNKKK